MRVIGVVLIILGILGFIFGGVSFTEEEVVADLGPIQVEAEQRRTIPITPLASGAAVVAGIALIVVESRKSRA